jgi:putative SOS response-associated peptidase YedK
LLATPPESYFDYFKVTSDVNNARNNGVNLIKPLSD